MFLIHDFDAKLKFVIFRNFDIF